LLGIEPDKNRCQQTAAWLAGGNSGGMALWSAIENATVDLPVSLLRSATAPDSTIELNLNNG
jgi:hypothetical protein